MKLEDINRSTVHDLTPVLSAKDRARQGFIFHAKRRLNQIAFPAFGQFAASHPDQNLDDLVARAQAWPVYAAWTALSISAQKQMWQALEDMISRQEAQLTANAAVLARRCDHGGSLALDPEVNIPDYLCATAFHGQPGGYVKNRSDEDISAGALTEAGGTLYSRGSGTGARDSKAQAVVRFVKQRFPALEPSSVLDLGCGFGGQTAGYALAWPDAETHGVELGTALLRFGHARAEAMGIKLHLHQMDLTHTSFPDAHFDLVVSNIVMHELPTAKLASMLVECHRLLKPGGVMVHQDVPTQKPDMPAGMQLLSQWQKAHNDEPFWQDFAHTSVPELMTEAGFDPEKQFEAYEKQLDGPLNWYLVGASR